MTSTVAKAAATPARPHRLWSMTISIPFPLARHGDAPTLLIATQLPWELPVNRTMVLRPPIGGERARIASPHGARQHHPVPRRPGRPGRTGRIVILPDSVHTAALAAEALGCEVGAIANSLLFDADGAPVLILTSGAHRVDTDKVAARARRRRR